MRKINVLFVCLGNICRSPMAEGIFQHLVDEARLTGAVGTDSAGTSNYHPGELPDPRMRQTAAQHGIRLTHRARQLTARDFEDFDYIVVMDQANLDEAQRRAPNDQLARKLRMMRAYDPTPEDGQVPDPYFGGTEGFAHVYQMLDRSCRQLLATLVKDHQLVTPTS